MKIIYKIALLHFIIGNIYGFKNLSQVTKYIAKNTEFPNPDNPNYLIFKYNNFHTNQNGTFLNKLLKKIYLKESLWTFNNLKSNLKYLINKRELNGYKNKFIINLQIFESKAQFIIWGPLHGQLHSLARSLQHFYNQKIIDNNFKIIKPNYYIIFNGNTVNGSAYNLETLTLITDLMKANPDKVFHIKGSYEINQNWLNYTLKHELVSRIKYSTRNSPDISLINRFFNTLPLALFINTFCSPNQFIRISYFNEKHNEINNILYNQSNYKNILRNNNVKKVTVYKLEKTNKKPIKPTYSKLQIKAIIKSQEELKNYSQHKGLSPSDLEQGITSWDVFSAPTLKNKNYLDFVWDAFSILTVYQNIDKSTLTLFNKDIRNTNKIKPQETYNAVSGHNIKIFSKAKN